MSTPIRKPSQVDSLVDFIENHIRISHIIPRRQGDVENPLGGIRGVIPAKKEY